uniref:Bestrophin homolog n=1 Tax=Timema poppense TaxID=170557 RepID=A0A7R9CXN6_TIMPO|nr:unnamed protein product [Timema poppensis]
MINKFVFSGFMTAVEIQMYQSVPSVEFNTYWIPCTWFISLLKETRKESRITDSQGLKIIMESRTFKQNYVPNRSIILNVLQVTAKKGKERGGFDAHNSLRKTIACTCDDVPFLQQDKRAWSRLRMEGIKREEIETDELLLSATRGRVAHEIGASTSISTPPSLLNGQELRHVEPPL